LDIFSSLHTNTLGRHAGRPADYESSHSSPFAISTMSSVLPYSRDTSMSLAMVWSQNSANPTWDDFCNITHQCLWVIVCVSDRESITPFPVDLDSSSWE
uniref:C2 domain-containing protein n=1 Tax=Haemonchus placei TaxID=6290 RepID=A0A0N4VWM8_HAEPC